jgi:hypothetical protein
MNFHNVKMEQVARFIVRYGMETFLKMIEGTPEVGAKYGERTLGHAELFFNQL